MARPIPLLLALTALVAGCKLIDQRTFNPRAGLGPPDPPTITTAPTPALITIDFEKPDPAYEQQLRQAVDLAVGRKPNVEFDVVTVVPAKGTPAEQVTAATSIRGDARDVARVISSEGVDDDRVHLLARAEAGAAGRQVQVFVH